MPDLPRKEKDLICHGRAAGTGPVSRIPAGALGDDWELIWRLLFGEGVPAGEEDAAASQDASRPAGSGIPLQQAPDAADEAAEGGILLERLLAEEEKARYDSLWKADDEPGAEGFPLLAEETGAPSQQIINDKLGNNWKAWSIGNGTSEIALDEGTVLGNAPYALKISNRDYNWATVSQTVEVRPRTRYIFSAYVKYSGFAGDPAHGGGKAGACIGFTDAQYAYYSAYRASDEWTKLTCSFETKDVAHLLKTNNPKASIWHLKRK